MVECLFETIKTFSNLQLLKNGKGNECEMNNERETREANRRFSASGIIRTNVSSEMKASEDKCNKTKKEKRRTGQTIGRDISKQSKLDIIDISCLSYFFFSAKATALDMWYGSSSFSSLYYSNLIRICNNDIYMYRYIYMYIFSFSLSLSLVFIG